MPENQLNGRSLSVIAKDVAEGFVSVNPQLLKRFTADNYKELLQFLRKSQKDIRSQSFPTNDTLSIRKRNVRLQRLHQAVTVIEYSAREKRIPLI
jgi:preprotein translocase subunit SecA